MKKVKELIQDDQPQLPEFINSESDAIGGIAGSLERIACALEELVRTVKEKENLPPTPPMKREKA